MEIKVGQRVLCTTRVGNKNLANQVGKILFIGNSSNSHITSIVGIEFDNHINGHDGIHHKWVGKNGHCWNVYDHNVVPLTKDMLFEQLVHGHIDEEEYKRLTESEG